MRVYDSLGSAAAAPLRLVERLYAIETLILPSSACPVVAPSTASREALIKTLWPDKAMYGAIMLFVTGVTGVLWGLIGAIIDVTYASEVPKFLQDYPPLLAVLPSAAAMGLAYLAFRQHKIVWAYLACLAGFLSFAGLGVGPLLSLIALVFVVLAHREGEFHSAATRALTADMWPDKSLAASMLALVTGVLTTFWGILMVSGIVKWTGLSEGAYIFGGFAILAGLTNLVAARRLYYQKDSRLGTIAAVLGLFGFGFLLLGPIVSAANLVVIRWAIEEKEFDAPSTHLPARPGARA